MFAQHLEVLRDGGLADAELAPHGLAERPGGLLTVGEQFQDPAADRVAENVEGVHDPFVSDEAYISEH